MNVVAAVDVSLARKVAVNSIDAFFWAFPRRQDFEFWRFSGVDLDFERIIMTGEEANLVALLPRTENSINDLNIQKDPTE